jgi:hypothetical protein
MYISCVQCDGQGVEAAELTRLEKAGFARLGNSTRARTSVCRTAHLRVSRRVCARDFLQQAQVVHALAAWAEWLGRPSWGGWVNKVRIMSMLRDERRTPSVCRTVRLRMCARDLLQQVQVDRFDTQMKEGCPASGPVSMIILTR